MGKKIKRGDGNSTLSRIRVAASVDVSSRRGSKSGQLSKVQGAGTSGIVRLPDQLTQLHVKKFTKFLQQSGAEILTLTSPWEVIRVSVNGVIAVLYKNKRDRLAWPDELKDAYRSYKSAGKVSWSGFEGKVKTRRRTPIKVQTIQERDGPNCWYCDCHMPEGTETVEHMLDVSKGGTNHIHNLVLACNQCNQAAKYKSVAEKVLLRESRRRYIK